MTLEWEQGGLCPQETEQAALRRMDWRRQAVQGQSRPEARRAIEEKVRYEGGAVSWLL